MSRSAFYPKHPMPFRFQVMPHAFIGKDAQYYAVKQAELKEAIEQGLCETGMWGSIRETPIHHPKDKVLPEHIEKFLREARKDKAR